MSGGSRINISNPKEICSNFQQKILTSSELDDPKKPHVSYHYPTAALPTSIFKTNFKLVQICICNKICRWTCRLAEKSDSTPLKTFVIFETNCVLAYICIYLHICLRQNLDKHHHLPVCRLRC